uniref:Mini-chromosome maintenance complex-binding protein n=1 Tax=Dunaliella tertiolecta TaxID=3047 RepID=A0A7S3QV56_DUNTE|mmetsp:Transcript_4438/g.12076  ORF Transcript_4438/g.12076 Transcript_4438/m.12076 type:complete len:550 (-) Transcript_4438:341-1990(-)
MPAPCCNLSAPLHVVQTLYQNAGAPLGCHETFGVPEHFKQAFLTDSSAREKVPVIGSDSEANPPREGSLVRFRGMVADMEDPEYYYGCVKYKDGSWATSKYGGTGVIRSNEEPTDSRVWERRPFHCVPVPGEASWVARAPNASEECTVYVYDQHDQNVPLHSVVDVIGVYTTAPEVVGLVEENKDEDQKTEALAPRAKHQVHAIILDPQTEGTVSPEQQQEREQLMGSSARVLQAREAALKLLQHALGGDALGAEALLLSLLSQATTRAPGQPTTSSAPLNIILPPESPMTSAASAPSSSATSAAASSSQPSIPTSFGAALHAVLGALSPLCTYLPLSVDHCNSCAWAPKRDFDNNRLSRSPLQLSNGTVLLVDETPMGEGRLSETGLSSFQALNTLIQEQALLYDFQVYKHPVPVNVTPIVLSKGRSMMHGSLPMKLHLKPSQALPTVAQVASAVAALNAQELQDIRTYLAAAKQQQYGLSESMVKQLQEEFVAARKGNRMFSPENFHAQLTVARLAALSFGEQDLSMDRWKYVLNFEKQLESREPKK